MVNKYAIIPVFIPELACPFQCLYCNQKKIIGKLSPPSDKKIHEIIINHLQTIPESYHVELAFFGGNFTGISRNKQLHFLGLIQNYLKAGKINAIRCSTRPDYIHSETLEILKSNGVQTIEIGAQSMDEEVLSMSKRGHTVNDVIKASRLIQKYGFNLGIQMMIGLPGDSKEKSIMTAQKIIELGARNTRIYPTLVIKGTNLEKLYSMGKYKPLSLEEAIEWTSEILKLFEKADVNILRVGLHPSDGLLNGYELVAGPFHPSFRELVYTEIWRKKLNEIIYDSDSICIKVNPSELNYAIGYGGLNKKKLRKVYRKVNFKTDLNIKNRDFLVDKI